ARPPSRSPARVRSPRRAGRARPPRRPRTGRSTCPGLERAARARATRATSLRRPSPRSPRRRVVHPTRTARSSPRALLLPLDAPRLARPRRRSARRRRLRGLSGGLGGVPELRFGGGSGFGTIRRVMIPWPTVHRFVVIQYMSRPTGNRVITGTKKTGITINRIRWLRCADAEAKYPEATWLTT